MNHSFYKYNNTDNTHDGLKTQGRAKKGRRRRRRGILTGKDDGWKEGFHERREKDHSSKMHPCVLVISVAHMGLDLKSFPYFLTFFSKKRWTNTASHVLNSFVLTKTQNCPPDTRLGHSEKPSAENKNVLFFLGCCRFVWA